MISGKDEMRDFLRRNKGRRIIVTLEAHDKGSTPAQLAYYRLKILPDLQEAFRKLGNRMTIEDVEELMLSEYYKQIRIPELDKEDMSDWIDFLKQYAAENLFTFIDDYRTI